jgi:predicted DNA-binding transcriptional regulator YafY
MVPTAGAVEGALAKVERLLPTSLRQRLSALKGTLVTDLAPAGSATAPASAVVVALSESVQARRRVWLRYTDAQGGETAREFDPYGLAYVSGRWYVAGYCHLRRDQRVFRIDRIARIEPRTATFTPPTDLDPLAVVQASLATAPGLYPVEVLLKTTLEVARARVSPTLATLEEVEGGVLLRAQTEDAEWMARTLAGLGFPLEVRQPEALRGALSALARAIAPEPPPGARAASPHT